MSLNATHCDHNNNIDSDDCPKNECTKTATHTRSSPKNDRKQTRPTTESAATAPRGADVQVQLKHKTINNNQLPRRILSIAKRQMSREVQTRALVSRVAEYYENYVIEMNLSKYFCNDTLVTSIRPVHGGGNIRWLVFGIKSNGKPFAYSCRNVVLANGASDLANRLGLREENTNSSWIKHDLPQLETALANIPDAERSSKCYSSIYLYLFISFTSIMLMRSFSATEMKPVLIVGAGLSAADAVTICRSSGIPVIHVFRNRSAGLDKMLPETVYPEYHEVHKMMKDCTNPYYLYTPLPEHCIVDFASADDGGMTNRITVQHLTTGETRTLDVSFAAILIGFRPDLHFLSSTVIKPVAKHYNDTIINNNHNHIRSGVPCDRDDMHSLDENDEMQQSDAFTTTTTASIDQQLQHNPQQWTILTKKINWLKNLCVKCKHLNLCEWSRRNECLRKLNGHSNRSPCLCHSRQTMVTLNNSNCNAFTNDTEHNNHSNNNINNNHSSFNDNSNNCQLIHSGQANSSSNNSNLSAIGLGEDPTKPIDCKTNPIAVDKFTNKVLRAPAGLYAMGPLVGDNFIRFIPGGALAITSALHKEND